VLDPGTEAKSKPRPKRGQPHLRLTRGPQTMGTLGGSGGGADGRERVEGFLKGRLSVWQPSLPLVELGLDSLDLVQLRNGFQKAFKLPVPMAYFTNAQQTLDELLDKLVAKMS